MCVSVGAVCAGKVKLKCTWKWKKGEKNSWFRGSPSSVGKNGWKRTKKAVGVSAAQNEGLFAFLLRTWCIEKREFLRSALFSLCVCLSVCVLLQVSILILILIRVTLHVRIANQVVKGSRCRGGIVNIRGGCSRARSVPPKSPKAIWRFRASTSNSLSGRSGLQTDTHIR